MRVLFSINTVSINTVSINTVRYLLLVSILWLAALQPVQAAVTPPVVDFTSDVVAGEAPLVVNFRDLSSGDPTAWAWDFGDGATSIEQHPTHTYAAPGGYTVTLTATSSAGADTRVKKTYIIANSPPVPEPIILENDLVTPPERRALPANGVQAAGDPNTPVLQNPANGATGVSAPSTTLETCVSDPDGGNLTVTFYGRDVSPISVPDFTLVALPDTQNYYSADGTAAPGFLAQAQWIVANRASRNIVFVTHLGDVVDDGSVPGSGNADAQWQTADGIMQNIESQALTSLLDGIPYGIAVGNHDQGPSFGDPSKTQLYNQHFGISRFSGRQYYGGHLGSDNDNSYQLFSVGDLKFIIVHIEFDTSNRPATFTWVDDLLRTHADRWAILSAHEILHSDGNWRDQGQKIWNGVRDNPNLFLMLAGHIGGEGRRQDAGYHGNTVNTLLSDYQNRANGGDGWLRYMEFAGASSELTVYTYSATKQQYEQDSSSFFKVAFDTPSSGPLRRPFQIIAQKSNVPSGSCTTATWDGLAVNHQYEWYVGVSDSPSDAADVQTFSSRATFSTANVNALRFSSSTYSVNENAGTATITVNLNRTSNDTVSVNYATSNGTASAGSDYSATSGTLTFASNETSKTFTVPVSEDSLDEADETVNLTLSNPSNAALGAPANATLTILDNDPAVSVQFSSATYSANENAGSATVTVNLSAASGLPVSVNYATGNGTATAGSDYTAASGALTFTPGQTSKTFTVPISDDTADEADETVNLSLSSPSNATLGTPSNATLTILDNDNPVPSVQFSSATYSANENAGSATVTVNLSAASALPVSVNYATTDGTASSGSDYTAASGTLTFASNETSKTFTVPVSDDSLDEADETLNLALSNPSNATLGTPASATLTILDNDPVPTVQFSSAAYSAVEGADAVVTVHITLNTVSSLPVAVEYATGDATAHAGSDYSAASGTVTFAPGETDKTFTVSISDDNLDESDETVALSLSNPSNATLGAPASATLTILDDDTPPVIPTVQFHSATISVDEGAGTATIQVTLSAASDNSVTVHYATSDGTATAGSDYGATDGSLTFNPGQTSRSFSVSISNDTLDETDETVNLALSDPANATLGTPASATLTILDDDEAPPDAPTVQFSSATASVAEGAGTATIQVTLSEAAPFPVSVQYATSDGTATAGSDYSASSGTLTFSPGQTSQSFSISISDDSDPEDDETVMLTLSNPSNATLGTPASATLTILDNDDPTPVIPTVQFQGAASVNENAGTATIQVTLSAASDSSVLVNYVTEDGTASAGSDYSAAAGTLTFAPGQTSQSFPVVIHDDSEQESDETVTLTLSNPTNAVLGASSTTLTIIDDDGAPLVQFNSSTYSALENSGQATIEVTLSSAATDPVLVNYVTENGTASAGSDYGATGGTLTFAPGQTSQSFTVSIHDDSDQESDETVMLTLSHPTNAALGAPSTATLVLRDDDAPATTPTVQFGSDTHQVAEDAGTATVPVVLSRSATQEIRVDYTTDDGRGTTASGVVIFAPGQTEQQITLPITDDTRDESDEVLHLTLSNAINAALGAPISATLTIVDNDDAPLVQVQSAIYTAAGGRNGGVVTIEVILSPASGKEVSVGYVLRSSVTSAAAQMDKSGVVPFAPGETQQRISIPLTQAEVEALTAPLSLTLHDPVNAVLGPNGSALITIEHYAHSLYLPMIRNVPE